MVPALDAIADAVDTGIYLIEGDWTAASISAAAMVPLFGDVANGARIVERTVARDVARRGSCDRRSGRAGRARRAFAMRGVSRARHRARALRAGLIPISTRR
jgi:hypothetical protein